MSLTPKSRLAQAGLSLVLIAAVAGVTLGVTTLLGVTFQGSGEAQPAPPTEFGGGFLLTTNRDHLAICVEAVGLQTAVLDEVGTEAKANVEAALVEVAKHPLWERARSDVGTPTVDAGCPSDPPPFFEGESKAPIEDLRTERVTQPSEYRMFVFVLAPDQLVRLMGGGQLRHWAQEMICLGDDCTEVTTSLYVDSNEVRDMAAMTSILTEALGLPPATQQP
jgi:hypothetical protein